MSAEALEGLLEIQVAQIVQRHRNEASIQEMQHAMLCSADVHIDREPLTREGRIPGLPLIIVRWVAQVVPRRFQEIVAHVCFAPRR